MSLGMDRADHRAAGKQFTSKELLRLRLYGLVNLGTEQLGEALLKCHDI